MDGRALWAESATGVPLTSPRSEHAAVSQATPEDAALQTRIREVGKPSGAMGVPGSMSGYGGKAGR